MPDKQDGSKTEYAELLAQAVGELQQTQANLKLTRPELDVLEFFNKYTADFHTVQAGNLLQSVQIQIGNMIYIHQFKDECIFLGTPENRYSLVCELARTDCAELNIRPAPNAFASLMQKQLPTLGELFEVVDCNSILHYLRNKKEASKKYRTASQADTDRTILPDYLAILTNKNYQNSLSLYQNGNAYLQPIITTRGLRFSNGRMYFDGEIEEISEVQLQDLITQEGIESIDLPLLQVFYSIILRKFEQNNYRTLNEFITVYVPDLAEAIGLQRNLNEKNLNVLIDKIKGFHNIVGVMHGKRGERETRSLFPVLNFEGYDSKKNTIAFSSPYMNLIISTVYKIAVTKAKEVHHISANKPDESLSVQPLPAYSFMVNASIAKAKNKIAVENVMIIVKLIEQCGDHLPHISATTIIERNPQFRARLEHSKNPTTDLKRIFSQTWEYLHVYTRLEECYEGLKFPDPNDKAYLPTATTLSQMVFKFPHHGKKAVPAQHS